MNGLDDNINPNNNLSTLKPKGGKIYGERTEVNPTEFLRKGGRIGVADKPTREVACCMNTRLFLFTIILCVVLYRRTGYASFIRPHHHMTHLTLSFFFHRMLLKPQVQKPKTNPQFHHEMMYL